MFFVTEISLVPNGLRIMGKRLWLALKDAGVTTIAHFRNFATKKSKVVRKKPVIWILLVDPFFQVIEFIPKIKIPTMKYFSLGLGSQQTEAVLECDDGYLIDFNHEKVAAVVCKSDGSWKTVFGGNLIHKLDILSWTSLSKPEADHIFSNCRFSCQPMCTPKYPCTNGFFCDRTSGLTGRCIRDEICPQSPMGADAILLPVIFLSFWKLAKWTHRIDLETNKQLMHI